ncbi:MAG TPA: class II D-tagatose-bisphosphate aldolase, non-catalytic subunit [Anaerolineales bacterium]|nr:class II D-tagatose-bisphosphate aldolase, non-catalytic subunit [Anaerolineales bacterium]HNQ93438.1 class II D-tagatose-bisphosphate aldolase, non-catalytic subunit [Anaerolineales bacterium]HNS59577.1 class II D-tagatose-bisphosphate aldolase, non-catalytic subunit [Anaerolineales bacterium]
MYLDEIVAAQKRGEARGVASVCSAHPFVIQETLKLFERPLIEATCNQVNQFGGYTGMTPKDFVEYVRGIAEEIHFPFERIILGGDHLGPNVWQNEPAESAMQKSEEMIRQYVEAGFTKIHLDCSMKLADDPAGMLDVEVIARRAARLAKIAEHAEAENHSAPRYVIGTEVPIPGGATEHEEGVSVTKVEDVKQTIEVTREAFVREGLESAWERVVGIVVQPGVEFGDDFVLPYQADKAMELSKFIESQSLVYEAHSTDYQTCEALKNLVKDRFAILKVGPALTFAFREAVFALAMIENEMTAKDERSNIMDVLDDVMLKHPEHWKKYYRGDEAEQAFKRKYSLSDRARYYWVQPEAQNALARLMKNLGHGVLPYSLLSQFVGETNLDAAQVIARKARRVLEDYRFACG